MSEFHEKRRNEQADRVFNLHAQKAKKLAEKMGLEKTAGKPLEGPFYYIYLQPTWVLKTMGSANPEDFISHPDYWEGLVDTVVAPHYKITDPKRIEAIKNLPYSMPRGRVNELLKPGRRVEWAVLIGNDIKYSMALQKQILSSFNLGPQFAAGLVRFLPDDHEIMLANDFQQFEQLVTRLPDNERKLIKLPEQESPDVWNDDEV